MAATDVKITIRPDGLNDDDLELLCILVNDQIKLIDQEAAASPVKSYLATKTAIREKRTVLLDKLIKMRAALAAPADLTDTPTAKRIVREACYKDMVALLEDAISRTPSGTDALYALRCLLVVVGELGSMGFGHWTDQKMASRLLMH